MHSASELFVVLLLTSAGVLGCGGSQTPAEAPSASAPTPAPAAEPSPEPTQGAAERPGLTAEACEASGGAVVGDIGDGAIHRPDYRCPSGAPPSGRIRAPEAGPMAVEGSVCCPK
ncbi:MAG TPA: hypothetical protein VK524_02590 [Polyangiaceae bacterium]|nr:hypothetical protein [Polyangiaceae bacterium]